MPFDKDNDKIAITIPRFTLRDISEGPFQRFAEPYIVSVAADEHGQATPKLSFNMMEFPRVGKGETVEMLGDGHLV